MLPQSASRLAHKLRYFTATLSRCRPGPEDACWSAGSSRARGVQATASFPLKDVLSTIGTPVSSRKLSISHQYRGLIRLETIRWSWLAAKTFLRSTHGSFDYPLSRCFYPFQRNQNVGRLQQGSPARGISSDPSFLVLRELRFAFCDVR